ncbi:conserved hypothetical protein [Beutenbergia cavernae DSM 12333]|uniref:Uncharacterized protein n=1 Tax=Beutenbergia cavernae (strain ATCC BAA-8 / DSM 12333 / CCUG 43141 / JCM 11478 / NBRC 16432 / NCIMB 13614 / HKI 0122) TaxID=471853 RepID=C5BY93_BEUC1|nr:hypothetical protein [Beutenbergia cavernae]ACQ80993.1 conserved hypothetical protein [Beutenbergia cavernae DSM 12333]
MCCNDATNPAYTPGPDGPLPGPLPGPFPEPGPFPGPFPEPFPGRPPERVWPPRDFPPYWLCWRWGGISGRYSGSSGHVLLGERIDLRIDVDVRHNANSPVMHRVSADHFRRRFSGRPPFGSFASVYLESWIIDAPRVTWNRCSAVITGAVRYWSGGHAATTAEIVVRWSHGPIESATVTLTEGASVRVYQCEYVSDSFRELELELDYAASVEIAPLVPTYDTHAHNNRPADTPQRTLTIEETYREAGVAVQYSPNSSVVDDSAASFTSWSPGELHDAMETAFSRYPSTWPAWRMWGLQAGTFDASSVGGIMFDAAAAYGGAGDAPDRQGFAVFRNHSWFTDLVDGPPGNQDEAWAMRHFLYTWVHEAGHAFNLLHSWNKSRPSSLSWMNYDWKYDEINGADTFWSRFRFRFDDEELIHIRHGNRASVIMGADPWASGGHLEDPSGASADQDAPGAVELVLRTKDFVDFLEPVAVELRLRNLTNEPVLVDGRLDPVHGTTTVYVRTPAGRTVQYAPIMCQIGLSDDVVLAPADRADGDGTDRLSRSVPLVYGTGGFMFAEPGEYQVRAVYAAAGHLVVSNTVRIRVGQPASVQDDRFAASFLRPEVGLTIALGGSMSQHLGDAVGILTEAAERFAGSGAGVAAAETVARSIGRDFFRREIDADSDRMVKGHSADPGAALAITAPALETLSGSKDPAANLAEHRLVNLRREMHDARGDGAAAAKELTALADDLAGRGVNAVVLEEVRDQAGQAAPTRRRSTRSTSAKRKKS